MNNLNSIQENQTFTRQNNHHKQIRKEQHQYIFQSIRKQLIQSPREIIPQVETSLQHQFNHFYQLIKNDQLLSNQNELVNLQNILKFIRNMPSVESCTEQIAQFLSRITVYIMLKIQNQCSIKQHEQIFKRIRTIVFNCLSLEDKIALPFLKNVLPLLQYSYFLSLHHNIFINQLLPLDLKQSIVLNFISILENNKDMLLEKHEKYIEMIYIAVGQLPALGACIIHRIYQFLNAIYSVISHQFIPSTDKYHVHEYTINLLQKTATNQNQIFYLYKQKNIWSFMLKNIQVISSITNETTKIIGRMMYYDFMVEHLLNQETILMTYLERIIKKHSQKRIDRNILKNVLFIWSNVVVYLPGAIYFTRKQLPQSIIEIATYHQHNSSIFKEAQYIMQNLFRVFAKGDLYQKQIIYLLEIGSGYMLIQGLKSQNTIAYNILELLNILVDLQSGIWEELLKVPNMIESIQIIANSNTHNNNHILAQIVLQKHQDRLKQNACFDLQMN